MSRGLLRDLELPVTKEPDEARPEVAIEVEEPDEAGPEVANEVVDVVSEKHGADNVPDTCVVSDLVVGLLMISAEVEVVRAGKPALGDNRVVANAERGDGEVAMSSASQESAMAFAPLWMAASFAPHASVAWPGCAGTGLAKPARAPTPLPAKIPAAEGKNPGMADPSAGAAWPARGIADLALEVVPKAAAPSVSGNRGAIRSVAIRLAVRSLSRAASFLDAIRWKAMRTRGEPRH